SISVEALRRFTPSLPQDLLYAAILAYASAFQLAFRLNALLRRRPHGQSIRERATSLFDTLAPPFVWRHSAPEVMGWFRNAGFVQVEDTSLPDDDYGFNIRGVLSNASEARRSLPT